MSVQTTVLENGRWVTRSLDPYHVRAQNSATPRKEQSRPSINIPQTPSLAILTKTLVKSPVINRIIPARVRHQTKNDLLFVSANSVTIKEARGDYTLREIATKNDFDSAIKSARIIGERRKLTNHDHGRSLLPRDGDIWDDMLTNEDDSYIDEEDRPHCPAPTQRKLPPHILVLALESNRLVFLCAVGGRSDDPELLSSQKPLPAPTSPLQSLGEFMAVDPNSRAMAVAAHEGRAYIYMLKSMDELRADFDERSRLEPIKEASLRSLHPEQLILLDGSILKMEFLHPPEGEPNRIILLLVVAKSNHSRLIWYDWNGDMPLHQAQLSPNKIPLHPDEQLPLLLIPLIKNCAFILVCEKRIVLIKDILTGGFQRYFHHLASEQESQEPGASQRRPIWVQWARPMRSKKFRPNEENIILCREDGIVQYMVIDHSIKQMIDSNYNVGRLGVNINTSFATVDLGLYADDLLVAAGNESDGGLWRFPPRQRDPNQHGIMPNWTPINDFAVANVPADRQNAGAASAANNTSKGQQRLFACSGRGKHGAISEMRYGVEATKKISTVALHDESKNEVLDGVLEIWALHGFYGDIVECDSRHVPDVTLIVMSHPSRTYLLQLRLEQDLDPQKDKVGLLEADVNIIGHDLGLDLSCRTIAVGRTNQGLTVQITETSIRVTSLPLPVLETENGVKEEDTEDNKPDKDHIDAERSRPRYMYSFEDSRILAACIHATNNNTIIVSATQQEGCFYLEFGTFAKGYQPLDQRIPLHAQPSCLSLLAIENGLLVLVGTVAGELEVYAPGDIVSGLSNTAASIRHAFARPFGICDSIATMTRVTTKGVQPLIVCGLRDGTVETIDLTKGVGTYQLSVFEKISIGHTSVSVLKDTTTNRVILHCEDTLCTLQYPHNVDKVPATVLNVWVTDPSAPSIQLGKISAIRQVVDSWLPGGNPGFTAQSFVCIDGERLHTISLNTEQTMVPRRLELGGSPIRVLYSMHLDKLIVLHSKYEVLRAARQINGRSNVPGKRALRPTISFLNSGVDPATGLDPDAMDIDDENDNQALISSICRPEEKFLGITEWLPHVGGNPYHMLVVNTVLTRAHKPVGRLLFFAIPKGKRDQSPKLVKKKIIDTGEPVYSVATYSNTSLVYCCGNDLCMQTLGVADPPRISWQILIKITMRSPARHITVKEPYIYVSSTRESFSVYRYDDGQLLYQFGDQHARSGLHHLQLPSRSLILASDMAGTVVGLWQPPERRIDNAMTTIFEAVLPTSITRLRRISRPVWSRHCHELHGENLKDVLRSPWSLDGAETILGSSADGTLTQFSILSPSEWRLLRFIQNLAERHPLVCPFHPGNPHKRHVEPSTARPHHMHVNGDILERVLDRGGEKLLGEMLDVEPDVESHTDFGSGGERRERFEELAGEVVQGGRGEVLGRVVLWVRYLLRNAL